MDMHNIMIKLLVNALPFIFAITLHEAAHGYVARRFGDSTAYMLGRVTLNPAKHIDLIGTILIPAALIIAGASFLFGWAKPVPVNFNNLRSPKRDSLWVAFAGPGANIIQVFIWAIVARILVEVAPMEGLVAPFWLAVCEAGIMWNIMFALINLLPILPLDGGRILASLLPDKASYAFSRTEPYGFFVVMALALTGVLSLVLGPPFLALMRGTYSLFGFQ
ncbi:MAG: site-2 protease family protein [Usitatibacter sp.]